MGKENDPFYSMSLTFPPHSLLSLNSVLGFSLWERERGYQLKREKVERGGNVREK